jgi:hypothetical protein
MNRPVITEVYSSGVNIISKSVIDVYAASRIDLSYDETILWKFMNNQAELRVNLGVYWIYRNQN